jgi:hypothetical protein
MRYVLLIYRDEVAAAQMTQEEMQSLMTGHAELAEALGQRLLGGGPLHLTTSATTVRLRGGKTLMTDGPFAETKEQLAGFYIVNCQNLDEALAWAAKVPDATTGSVEIRPMLELS